MTELEERLKQDDDGQWTQERLKELVHCHQLILKQCHNHRSFGYYSAEKEKFVRILEGIEATHFILKSLWALHHRQSRLTFEEIISYETSQKTPWPHRLF